MGSRRYPPARSREASEDGQRQKRAFAWEGNDGTRAHLYLRHHLGGWAANVTRPPAAAKRARTGKGKSGRLPGRAMMARERIYIYDTTLRDGQQTPGVDFSVEDKKSIVT
ncbi:citramalate synthase, partial [Brucella abortus]